MTQKNKESRDEESVSTLDEATKKRGQDIRDRFDAIAEKYIYEDGRLIPRDALSFLRDEAQKSTIIALHLLPVRPDVDEASVIRRVSEGKHVHGRVEIRSDGSIHVGMSTEGWIEERDYISLGVRWPQLLEALQEVVNGEDDHVAFAAFHSPRNIGLLHIKLAGQHPFADIMPITGFGKGGWQRLEEYLKHMNRAIVFYSGKK